MTEVINVSDLKKTVLKIEKLENEKTVCADYVKEGYAEATSLGFCAKTIKQILKLRKKEKAKIEEEDCILELYRDALDI